MYFVGVLLWDLFQKWPLSGLETVFGITGLPCLDRMALQLTLPHILYLYFKFGRVFARVRSETENMLVKVSLRERATFQRDWSDWHSPESVWSRHFSARLDPYCQPLPPTPRFICIICVSLVCLSNELFICFSLPWPTTCTSLLLIDVSRLKSIFVLVPNLCYILATYQAHITFPWFSQ